MYDVFIKQVIGQNVDPNRLPGDKVLTGWWDRATK
jgi:hypothetical protein